MPGPVASYPVESVPGSERNRTDRVLLPLLDDTGPVVVPHRMRLPRWGVDNNVDIAVAVTRILPHRVVVVVHMATGQCKLQAVDMRMEPVAWVVAAAGVASFRCCWRTGHHHSLVVDMEEEQQYDEAAAAHHRTQQENHHWLLLLPMLVSELVLLDERTVNPLILVAVLTSPEEHHRTRQSEPQQLVLLK